MLNLRNCGAFAIILLGLANIACAAENSGIAYEVSLKDAASHYADVSITFQGRNGAQIQMPVWNATYIVRDFAVHIGQVQASSSGAPVPVVAINKDTWQAKPGAVLATPITFRYRILLSEPGPFGADVSSEHAFFNFAQALAYPVGQEHVKELVSLRITDAPAGWKIATALTRENGATGFSLRASSYDELVDSPTELGNFQERDFQEGGKHYRVVVHGKPGDYDLSRMAAECQKIVRAETDFMHEAPYEEYTFLYHVEPNGGGGMEHKYSTAIGLRPLTSDEAWRGFEGVTAHEFFHLWNVKRIRPQTLEPVDYTKEQYTRDLWFSEGFTSTVAQYALLRAGLESLPQFEKHLSQTIQNFRERPAHLWQSPQESSLETWYDKYPFYSSPERSISYYTSGELIGYALDLALREKTGGKKSLRDLFLWMNETYPHQGKFFPETRGEFGAAEAVSGADFQQFFSTNIDRAGDLPMEEALATAGLKLQQTNVAVGDVGFRVGRGSTVIAEIDGEPAKAAGLQVGDEIVELNGQPAGRALQRRLASAAAGSQLHLKFLRSGVESSLTVPVVGRQAVQWQIIEAPNATPRQVARRKAWVRSEDQP
ncbi:MAG: PDZ domain-containing protein [Acidobacteriaceae bacterium]